MLSLIEKYLPTIITAFTFGYYSGSKDKIKLEVKLQDTEAELERERNRRAIEEANKVFDDRSYIARAISKGRDILRGKQ